jgi:hypothetical protein
MEILLWGLWASVARNSDLIPPVIAKQEPKILATSCIRGERPV